MFLAFSDRNRKIADGEATLVVEENHRKHYRGAK
jgi:hypothetical protein